MTWTSHLQRLDIVTRPSRTGGTLALIQDPVRIATEAAIWGSVNAHEFLLRTVIVSDDAGQFDVGRAALCRVHAGRLVYRLDMFAAWHRQVQSHIYGLIGWVYADLKAYRTAPSAPRRAEFRARFDRIFSSRIGFATLDRRLERLHADKSELLQVLDGPDIPLHTNGSKNDIRCKVTKQKISGGTRSDSRRDCRYTFLGLVKTCAKLGIRFWDYLCNRLVVPGAAFLPPPPQIVQRRRA